MQEQHDYLKSSFWCKEEIIDPYQTIALIFDEANVSIYRNNIKNILRTTYSYRRWKEHPLNNPFFTFENSLLKSAEKSLKVLSFLSIHQIYYYAI